MTDRANGGKKKTKILSDFCLTLAKSTTLWNPCDTEALIHLLTLVSRRSFWPNLHPQFAFLYLRNHSIWSTTSSTAITLQTTDRILVLIFLPHTAVPPPRGPTSTRWGTQTSSIDLLGTSEDGRWVYLSTSRGSVTPTPLMSTSGPQTVTSTPVIPPSPSSLLLGSVSYDFLLLSFSLLSTYNPLLYKVFKILFVLYDVSMVMFFIKEEENLFLLLVCFIILFLNWYCKISMQELLSGAFLFKNVICVINGRICWHLSGLSLHQRFFSQRSKGCWLGPLNREPKWNPK